MTEAIVPEVKLKVSGGVVVISDHQDRGGSLRFQLASTYKHDKASRNTAKQKLNTQFYFVFDLCFCPLSVSLLQS